MSPTDHTSSHSALSRRTVRADGRGRRSAAATLAVGVLATFWLLVASAAPATAHSELASSNPAQGQVLEQMPSQVELTFNQNIAPEFAAVTLSMISGGQPTAIDVTVKGTNVTAAVPPDLQAGDAGRWRIAYRVTSADGHPIDGTVDFKLRADAPAPAPTSEPASGPSSAPSSPATTGETDQASESSSAQSSASEPSVADGASGPADAGPSRSTGGGSQTISTILIGLIAALGVTAALVWLTRRKEEE